ncbi:MAG: ABC transporter substrate-binding protein, partial [Candidatus Binatia bacterium]
MKNRWFSRAGRLRAFILSMAIMIIAVTGLMGVHDAKAQTKFTAGTVFLSATAWPHYVAADKGYLKARGLDVDIIATRSSAKAVQQLSAGSIQVNSSGMPDNLRAINKGAPMKIIMTQVATPPYMVFAKPSIKSILDL